MPDVAWLNGRFMPLAEAKVSAMDRGFLFGDAVYEALRATGGRAFLLEGHLRRLAHSARMIGLTVPARGLLRRTVQGLLQRAGYREAMVYIQVSRGVSLPRKHAYPPRGTPPTVLLAAWEAPARPEKLFARGVSCLTMEDFRWGRCDIKTVNLLPNCMGKEQAARRGAFEVIFVKEGFLLEGASSAVFVVRAGRLLAPPQGPELLPSLTRELVERIARGRNIPLAARRVSVKEMFAADEVFLASTTAEGLPVVRIDGRRIGTGRPGPVAAAIHAAIVRRREA